MHRNRGTRGRHRRVTFAAVLQHRAKPTCCDPRTPSTRSTPSAFRVDRPLASRLQAASLASLRAAASAFPSAPRRCLSCARAVSSTSPLVTPPCAPTLRPASPPCAKHSTTPPPSSNRQRSAGTGATVGKLMGPATCMKAGLGAAAVALGPIKVGAVVSVNACGNVVDPFTGEWVAGMRAAADSDQIVDMELAAFAAAGSMQMPLDRTNTTISCIVTNVELTKHKPPRSPRWPQTPTHTPSAHTHHQRRRHHLHPRQRQTGRPASAAVPLDLLACSP